MGEDLPRERRLSLAMRVSLRKGLIVGAVLAGLQLIGLLIVRKSYTHPWWFYVVFDVVLVAIVVGIGYRSGRYQIRTKR